MIVIPCVQVTAKDVVFAKKSPKCLLNYRIVIFFNQTLSLQIVLKISLINQLCDVFLIEALTKTIKDLELKLQNQFTYWFGCK